MPNYGVSVAEIIIPAPTCPSRSPPPGTEASGTGNMKLALNGALTIGTDDGANIEIRENVGDDNIFIFGLSAAEVLRLPAKATSPAPSRRAAAGAAAVLDAIGGDASRPGAQALPPIVDSLVWGGDHYICWPTSPLPWHPGARRHALWPRPRPGRAPAIANVAGMGRSRPTARSASTPSASGACRCAWRRRRLGHPPRPPAAPMVDPRDVAAGRQGAHGDPFWVLARTDARRTALSCAAPLMPGAGARRSARQATRAGERWPAAMPDGFFERPQATAARALAPAVRWHDGQQAGWTIPTASACCWARPTWAAAEGTHRRPGRCWARTCRWCGRRRGTRFAVAECAACRARAWWATSTAVGRPPHAPAPECRHGELFVPGVGAGRALQVRDPHARRPLLPRAPTFAASAELRAGHGQHRRRASCRPCRPMARAAAQCAGRAHQRLRGAPGIVAAVVEDGDRWLDWDELADHPGALRRRHGLHPPGAARCRASLRRLLGLPADPGLYAPTARFGAPDGPAPLRRGLPAGIGRAARLGAGALPPTRTAWRVRRHALYEYADPRQGWHPTGTRLIFNLRRNEVRQLPPGNALFWSRLRRRRAARGRGSPPCSTATTAARDGQWVPNVHGGRENLRRSPSCATSTETLGAERPGRPSPPRSPPPSPACRVRRTGRRPGLPPQVEHGLDARHAAPTWRATRSTGATTTASSASA